MVGFSMNIPTPGVFIFSFVKWDLINLNIRFNLTIVVIFKPHVSVFFCLVGSILEILIRNFVLKFFS